MSVKLFAFLLLLTVFCTTAQSGGPAATTQKRDTDVILFREPLPLGRELVVIRGPDRSIADLAGFVNRPKEEIKAVYTLHLEVRSPGVAPLEIGARLVSELDIPGQGRGGFDILDAQSKDGQIVLATAENGLIGIWRFTASGQVQSDFLRGWMVQAAMSPIDPRKVSAKLSWNKDNLIEVKVVDSRGAPGLTRHTQFRQDEKDWQFKAIEAHEERH
ncbi:MAG TPA: hypothetical protein VHQ47_06050 [Phycisphaerae bacterium]|nr:hypothetical protein [Phycisphaerae bacterium]